MPPNVIFNWDPTSNTVTMQRSDGDNKPCSCQMREAPSCDPSLFVRFDPYSRDTDKDWIDGYIAVWESRDCYGTWFNPNDPPVMGLDNLPVGIWYEHGRDPEVQGEIGKVTKVWTDDKGIAFKGYLHKDSKYYHRVADEIKRRKLATSSGAVDYLSKFSKTGQFLRWIIGELSLTKNPCERTMPKVTLGRETRSLGLIFNRRHVKGSNQATDGAASRRASLTLDKLVNPSNLEGNMPTVAELMQTGTATPEELLMALADELGGVEAVKQLLQETPDEPSDGMLSQQQGQQQGVAPLPTQRNTDGSSTKRGGSNDGGRTNGSDPNLGLALQLLTAALKQRSEGNGATNPNTAIQNEFAILRDEVTKLRNQMMSSTDTDDDHADNTGGSGAASGSGITDVTDLRYDHLSTRHLISGAHWHYLLYRADRDGKVKPMPKRFYEVVAGRVSEEIGKGAKLGRRSYRSIVGRRADEIINTTQAGGGAEWVKIAYDENMWEVIRQDSMYQEVLKRGMLEIEIPDGTNTWNFSTEGSDPIFYVVPETTDIESNSKIPLAQLTSSKYSTGERDLKVKKIGSVLYWSGEQDEDSIINALPEAQRKMDEAYQDQIEYLMINGDTDLTLNTNINLIDGTPTATADGSLPSYTAFDGFLKLALLGAAGDNARDAAGALDETDYLELLKLMGVNGKNAIKKDKMMYIIDNLTYYATLALSKLQDADTHKAMTFKNGEFEGVWGRTVFPSEQMGLADATGAISGTPSNNVKGRILSVRPDQWRLGWKRHTESEVTRYPKQDTTELVMYIRVGLAYRDAEAAAVTYNITV